MPADMRITTDSVQCPVCSAYFEPSSYFVLKDALTVADEDRKYEVQALNCPACTSVLIVLLYGLANETVLGTMQYDGPPHATTIYPPYQRRDMPEEIPEQFRRELQEAWTVFDASPKAAAALGRRLLEQVLEDHFEYPAKKSLAQKIDRLLKDSTHSLPKELLENVDVIREVGNFAAHPTKSKHSGEIVEVEPGEAEWILEVLEDIFDFIFVRPERSRAKRANLNAKLKEHGKKPLKGLSNSIKDDI